MTPNPRTMPSGVDSEAVLGTAQFKFRTPEAILHVRGSSRANSKGVCGLEAVSYTHLRAHETSAHL
eukprot:15474704-Alexandrium_andersonii.AAC.1